MGCCCISEYLGNCIGGVLRTVMRWGLLGANVLFFIAGIGITTVGILINMNVHEWDFFYSDEALVPSILCIVAGCATMLSACLAVAGTFKRIGRLLFAYSAFATVAFMVLLAAGITSLTLRPEFEEKLQLRMIELMALYSPVPGGNAFVTEATMAWDKIQTENECCGVTAMTDWGIFNPIPDLGFPASCDCLAGSEGCVAVGAEFIYADGCYPKLLPHSVDMVIAIGGSVFLVAGLKLVSVIMSLCLASIYCNSKKGSRKSSDSS